MANEIAWLLVVALFVIAFGIYLAVRKALGRSEFAVEDMDEPMPRLTIGTTIPCFLASGASLQAGLVRLLLAMVGTVSFCSVGVHSMHYRTSTQFSMRCAHTHLD
jgi:hypothetical protein